MCHSTVYAAEWTEKLNIFKSVSVTTVCSVKKLQANFKTQCAVSKSYKLILKLLPQSVNNW